MTMFDDKVGGLGWLNADVSKKKIKTTLKSIYPLEDITD